MHLCSATAGNPRDTHPSSKEPPQPIIWPLDIAGVAMDDFSQNTDVLLDADRRHLIHPLHHPKDHANARIFTRGEGAILHTSDGKQYIDGLSALWNVNIGHGRQE